jgi:hypothetical protein
MNDVALPPNELTLSGVPEGLDALVLAQLAANRRDRARYHHRRARRPSPDAPGMRWRFAPKARISVPAWDAVPYDHGPNAEITPGGSPRWRSS